MDLNWETKMERRYYWSIENLNQLHDNINRNPVAEIQVKGNVRFIWCEYE